MGHHIRQCPDRRVSLRAGKEPGLSKRCRREKLWTSKHRPKRNDQGNLLLKNGHKGKLQVIDKFWGNQQPGLPQENPFKNIVWQPQAAQGSISALPYTHSGSPNGNASSPHWGFLEGSMGLLLGRSSIAMKRILVPSGVIDSDCKVEIKVRTHFLWERQARGFHS